MKNIWILIASRTEAKLFEYTSLMLLLVAEPSFLRKLRSHFERRPIHLGRVRAVNKELVHVSTKKLRLHLSGALLEMMQTPRRQLERHKVLNLSA